MSNTKLKNALITWASGSSFFEEHGFDVFLASLEVIPEDVDVYVFTEEMPSEIESKLNKSRCEIVKIAKEDIKFLYRERHLIYWEFVLKTIGKYKYLLFTDSRDIVFQRNPFEWIENFSNENTTNNFVVCTTEGMNHSQSEWNMKEQENLQSDIEGFRVDPRNRPIINGGIVLGTPDALKNHFFLIWSNYVRISCAPGWDKPDIKKTTGRCTDQAVINYLYNFLEKDPVYHIINPSNDLLCVTGEAIKTGHFNVDYKNNQFLHPTICEPFYLVHQWDRTVHRTNTIMKYVGSSLNEKS